MTVRRYGRRAKGLPQSGEILLRRPEYGPCGDVTRAFLTGGREEVLALRMDAVLEGLARRSYQDLQLRRRWAAQYTHRTVNNPIALSSQLILTPFRVRVAKVAGDTVMGFVNAAAEGGLQAVVPEEDELELLPEGALATALVGAGGVKLPRGGRSRSRLRAAQLGRRSPAVLCVGGLRIPTLWTLETLEKHLAGARLIRQLLLKEALETVAGLYQLRLVEPPLEKR